MIKPPKLEFKKGVHQIDIKNKLNMDIKNWGDVIEFIEKSLLDIKRKKTINSKCSRLIFFLYITVGSNITRRDFENILEFVEVTPEEFVEYVQKNKDALGITIVWYYLLNDEFVDYEKYAKGKELIKKLKPPIYFDKYGRVIKDGREK